MTTDSFDNIKLRFEQFLSLVGNVLAHEKDINIIQNKLRRHFNTTSSVYLCSTDFRSLLNRIHDLFNENDKSLKYFTSLASIDEQLKKHRIKLSGSSRSLNEASSCPHVKSVDTTPPINENAVITPSKSSTILPRTINEQNNSSEQTVKIILDNCSLELNEPQLLNNDQIEKITTNSVCNIECETKEKKKIHKLERQLSCLSDIIRQLEETDMSLDEMEYCDLYIVESKCKKRACEIYAKLVDLKKESSSIKRILDQPVSLSGCEIGHPLITLALEEMVNRTKCLPSFEDVVDTVDKVNEEYELNLSIDARKKLAEKSFKIIGTKIKTRRMDDFNDIMNSRLPESFSIEENDPALDNTEIENTLIENERQAVIQTEQILEEFSQIDPDLEGEDNIESCEESTDESDTDETGEKKEKMECESTTETFDNNEYDIVDILPLSSSKSSSPASSVADESVIEPIMNNDPVETSLEISLNDRTVTILSTASISLKRITDDSSNPTIQQHEPHVYTVTDDDSQSPSIIITKERTVKTLIPRRRDDSSNNETRYNIYTHRLTNNISSVQKRPISKEIGSSKSKKSKQQPEIIVLD